MMHPRCYFLLENRVHLPYFLPSPCVTEHWPSIPAPRQFGSPLVLLLNFLFSAAREAEEMRLVGLISGITSGKSIVPNLFKDTGVPVVDAGIIARVSMCDVDINTSDTSTPTYNQISDPITRARARQLNNQVFSFLALYSSYLYNGNMCSVLLLMNDGQKRNEVAFAPVAFGFQNRSSL
jgi:hypothetical protein